MDMTATEATRSMSLDEVDIHTSSEYRRHGYPWEAWDRLRAEAPVYWYERPEIEPFWAITRYRDIQWVSANDKLFVNGGGRLRLATIQEDEGARERWAKRTGELGWDPQEPMDMVFMDRPRHTRFRSLTARRFTPRSIRDHETDLDRYAARFAAELEQKLERDGEADLVMDFAIKLPLATICDLLGLSADDWSKVFDLTEIVTDDELAESHPGVNIGELRMQRSAQFQQYLATVIEGCRAAPRDDLLAAVVGGEVDGCPLTPQQLNGYLVLLLGAGNETTRNATSRGVTALLQHPEQMGRLVADPSLLESAVEEILRWTSPVIQFARTATTDVELGGQTIRAGQTVGLFYPSANRDDAVFAEPYRFDVGREPNRHIAFGHGVHFCLGSHLARGELRATLKALLPLLPRLELVGEPDRNGHLHVGAINHQLVQLRS
jgi:cholest-4-en-3-one 26-monooxygenase